MSKKIFTLAFVSAAFFLGCSADSSFTSPNNPPPDWDNALDNDPGTNTGGGGGGGSGNYCSGSLLGYSYCEELDEDFTADACHGLGGTLVNSCP
jgi:hypothetical protein